MFTDTMNIHFNPMHEFNFSLELAVNHKVWLVNWTVSLCFLGSFYFKIQKCFPVWLMWLECIPSMAHQPHASSFWWFSATFWSCPSTLNRQGTRYYSRPIVRAFKVIGKYCYLCFSSNYLSRCLLDYFHLKKKVFPCMAMWWEHIPSMGPPAPCLCVLAGFPPWWMKQALVITVSVFPPW